MKRVAVFILSLIFVIIGCCNHIAAQTPDTNTAIFNPNFKTLQTRYVGNEFFPPIITLNKGDAIEISFDELATEMRYLRYKLIHCNADWLPSDLLESEYIDGFNEAVIENYSFSSGTFANYVHYSFTLPCQDMIITKSGNYLVQVYDEESPNEILLQSRFYVTEELLTVTANATSRTDIDYNNEHQQVAVEISAKNRDMRNWHNDIALYVTQNSRTDNMAVVSRPNLIESNSVKFEHNKNLIFQAGNEFRRFEVVATNYPGLNVENIVHYNPYYHVELFIDQPRAEIPYAYDQTQFGRFKVRQSGAYDSNTDADYVIVHFALDIDQVFNGEIYLDGDFTNHRFSPVNKMRYNPETAMYEAKMLLKMGSYNYQYLFRPTGSNTAYAAPIEGNHHETVNEYFARVYYSPAGARYDRLVGFTITFSGK